MYALFTAFVFVIVLAVFGFGFTMHEILRNVVSSVATILGLYILLEYFQGKRNSAE